MGWKQWNNLRAPVPQESSINLRINKTNVLVNLDWKLNHRNLSQNNIQGEKNENEKLGVGDKDIRPKAQVDLQITLFYKLPTCWFGESPRSPGHNQIQCDDTKFVSGWIYISPLSFASSKLEKKFPRPSLKMLL